MGEWHKKTDTGVCFTYRGLYYVFVLYGCGFSLFCFRSAVPAGRGYGPSEHFYAYLSSYFYLSCYSLLFKVFRLLVCFSFFIVLPFFFRQDELVIFYITRAFALAFRIIHAVNYMIGFPFYHDHHLNINMALYSPLYEAENRTKFTENMLIRRSYCI